MNALHHVGVTVRDLDDSIRFYRDVLGLELLTAPSPWFEGEALSRGVGVPGAKLRVAVFALGDTHVELLQYAAPPSSTPGPIASSSYGASHLCFRVADIRARKAELEAQGVRFLTDVNAIDEGPLAGWRWVYFSDPDGYPLELVEIAYPPPEDERLAALASYLAARG